MSIVPRVLIGDLDLTDYPYSLVFGSDFGAPENIVVALQSELHDGEIQTTTGRGNRTITLPLLVEGADMLELAQNEAALVAETDRLRNELSLDPGDGYGPTTVYTTFAAQVVHARDDEMESALVRRYDLTISALPHGRSLTKIVDTAGTPPSTGGTLLDSCESATGWSPIGSVDSALFAEGSGSVKIQASASERSGVSGVYRFAASADSVTGRSWSTGTGGYLSIAIRTDWNDNIPSDGITSGLLTLQMQVAGAWIDATFTATGRDANGFVRYAWPVGAGLTVTGLRTVVHQASTSPVPLLAYVRYDDIRLLPSATTDHQIIKQLDVKGSARTTGSLHIAAALDSVALGQVLAITAPTNELLPGFQPDGRRWVTQGTTTTDATALDGSYFTPNTTYDSSAGKPIFDVPVGMLTAGPYTMVALVKAEASTLTFGVQAQLRIGPTNTGPLSAAEVSPSGLTTGWQFITVGTVYLPPLPTQGADTSTKVRLLFKGAKMSNVYMIPAWNVGGRPVADFSIVDCGTGTVGASGPSSNLWIDSPSVDQIRGGWWRGPTSDRLNARSAWPDAKKPGRHTFNPGALTAFLVSTGAQGPTLALEYFPTWHTHAGI